MNQQLEQIKELIRARKFREARQELQTYLARHPQDAEGWYLRSFVEPSKEQKIIALRQAIKFAPKHERALARLNQLQPVQKRKNPPVIVLLVLFLVLLAALAGIFLLLNGRPTSPIQIPTEMALNATSMTGVTATTSESVQAAAIPSATAIEPLTSTPLPVEPAQSSLTSAVSSDTPTAEEGSTTLVVTPQTQLTPVLSSPLPQVASATVPAALPPTANVSIVSPTFLPTAVIPAASPTLPPPPSDPGVPVGTEQDIGIGTLRVVQMTRPASSAIQQLGGSIPNPPAGQSWVLLELLLICTTPGQCLQNPSNFQVLGASGTWYGVSPALSNLQIFDTVVLQGQSWGYLGFVVPDSEATLRFVVLQGNQMYVYSLQ